MFMSGWHSTPIDVDVNKADHGAVALPLASHIEEEQVLKSKVPAISND